MKTTTYRSPRLITRAAAIRRYEKAVDKLRIEIKARLLVEYPIVFALASNLENCCDLLRRLRDGDEIKWLLKPGE